MGKGLDTAVQIIKEKYGAGATMKLSDQAVDVVPVISTGCLSLDLALGIGGIPRGRVSEFFGDPGCGKSTLMLHTVAEAQRRGLQVAYIDAENALDEPYA